jgi:hypothetical protein
MIRFAVSGDAKERRRLVANQLISFAALSATSLDKELAAF